MTLHLPTLNATLNGVAATLLLAGILLVRSGRPAAHGWVMGAAAVVSAAFLASYLTYHFAVVPEIGHTPFRREGAVRGAYYALLVTHVLLAVVNLPMVLWTLRLAAVREWARHRRLARWTFPIWMYVSVTGVLVYLALYVWNPPAPVS